jgi:hypothetical protein
LTYIRILYREPDGKIVDGQHDFGPENFAGQVPTIGDEIVNPGVIQGQDRRLPQNRQIWTVVGRVFNSKDNEDYVSLIVAARDGTSADEAYL